MLPVRRGNVASVEDKLVRHGNVASVEDKMQRILTLGLGAVGASYNIRNDAANCNPFKMRLYRHRYGKSATTELTIMFWSSGFDPHKVDRVCSIVM
ncbi:hypothetical protein M8J76_016412 [Diaphorina citri]|nr:hypothetical protein M8J76_016412 [Diaphorina citri]